MATTEDLVREVVVTADGMSKLASSDSSLGLRRRWGPGTRYENGDDYADDADDPWAIPGIHSDQNGIDDGARWSGKRAIPIMLRISAVYVYFLFLSFHYMVSKYYRNYYILVFVL